MTPTQDPYAAVLAAPFGVLGLLVDGDAVTGIHFLPTDTPVRPPRGGLARRLADQLRAYLADPARGFDLTLAPGGTDFRQRVWRILATIPCGQTRTYGDIARELGSSPRAVGQAVGDNPLPILIPCHRVVASDGGLGGFNHSRTGYSLDIKRWLLGHEGVR